MVMRTVIESGMNKAARQGQVNSELESLAKTVETLLGAASEIENRFSSVLSLQPTCGEAKIKEDEQLVPLAAGIREQRRKVQNATFILNEIRDRCEL